MLSREAYCEHCEKDTVHSSVWNGDPFRCSKCRRIKMFDIQTYECKQCNKPVEYDAAVCTFSERQKDGSWKNVPHPESEYCIECEDELEDQQ